jgi:cytochrome c peroxidase
MRARLLIFLLGLGFLGPAIAAAPLGLPPVPIPENNPQTPEKIALGDKLYHDALQCRWQSQLFDLPCP